VEDGVTEKYIIKLHVVAPINSAILSVILLSSQLHKNEKNQVNHNNILYALCYELSDDIKWFSL
jgi:hypothetical protein